MQYDITILSPKDGDLHLWYYETSRPDYIPPDAIFDYYCADTNYIWPEAIRPKSIFIEKVISDAILYCQNNFDDIKPVSHDSATGGLSPLLERVRTINPDFKRRRLAGEIVFSDYASYKFDAGWVTTFEKRLSFYPVTIQEKQFPFQYVSGPGRVYLCVTNNPWLGYNGQYLGRIYKCPDHIEKGFHKNPYIDILVKRKKSFSMDDGSKKVNLDRLKNGWEIDNLLVTDCLGDVNSKTLDVLTSLAELPETIELVYGILKQILLLVLKFKRELRRLAPEALKPDTYAKLWLQYRYGIMPLVYQIEDTIKVFENLESEYVDSRKKKVISKPSPYDEAFSEIQTHRVLIRRRLDISGKLKQYQNQLLFNPLQTAWELIPLSFVLDWVINVASFINALSTPGNITQEAAQYSVKTECDGSTDTKFVSYKFYERVVINPQSRISLGFNIDMNPKRYADLVSLVKVILLDDQKIKKLLK